jgi:hypothetical protein
VHLWEDIDALQDKIYLLPEAVKPSDRNLWEDHYNEDNADVQIVACAADKEQDNLPIYAVVVEMGEVAMRIVGGMMVAVDVDNNAGCRIPLPAPFCFAHVAFDPTCTNKRVCIASISWVVSIMFVFG